MYSGEGQIEYLETAPMELTYKAKQEYQQLACNQQNSTKSLIEPSTVFNSTSDKEAKELKKEIQKLVTALMHK